MWIQTGALRRRSRASPRAKPEGEKRRHFMSAAAVSAETTPETIAQEFIMAVMESAPFAPPTTQPAP